MLQSFLSTALPIVLAVLMGTWANNKRLDDLARRMDRLEHLLDDMRKEMIDIRKELASLGERLTRVEFSRH